MKITRLTTAVIESNFDWTIVKIETDEGLIGYGEAFVGPALAAVIREYAPVLVGEDPTAFDRVIRRLRLRSTHAYPGLTAQALGAIESALLDVTGKKFGLPVWQLLGGKYRDSVLIYADCHAGEALESLTPLVSPRVPHWMGASETGTAPVEISLKHHGWAASDHEHLSPEAYARAAERMVAQGFRALKFDVDVPTPYETDEYNRALSRAEIEYAACLVAAVRKAVGRDVALAIDCHWNYGVQAAVELARALEPYDLLWLEDPVPPENIAALAQVQRQTRLPIATGENHFHRLDFERLILEAGLRVLAPDANKLGIWESRKLADLADLHYVNLAVHNIAGPVGTLASAHLCAAIPNFLALEWHAASVPFFDALARGADGPLIRDGRLRVPDRPGLGVDLDEEVAWRYRKPGEPFFE